MISGAQAVLLEPRVELSAGEAEERRRLRLVAAGGLQGALDEAPLHVLQVHTAGGQGRGGVSEGDQLGTRRLGPADGGRQMLAGDQAAVAEQDGALDGVAQ